MNRILLILILSALPMAMTACGNDRDEESSSKVVTTQHQPEAPVVQEPLVEEDIKINGETPEDYYGHFLYQKTEQCYNRWYKLAGSFSFDMGYDEVGREVIGELNLMLLENGTYFAVYQESTILKRFDSTSYSTGNIRKTTFKDRWKIDGTQIVFGKLGRGYAMLVNGRRSIQLQVERSLIRSGLKGRTVEIVQLNSNNVSVPELDNCGKR